MHNYILIYVHYVHTGTEKIFEAFRGSPLEWITTDSVPPASKSDAAMAGIEATSLREAELWFPSLFKIVYIMRTLGLRELVEWNYRRVYNAFNS